MSAVIEFNDVWKKFKKGEKFNSLRDSIPRFFRNLTRKSGHELDKEEFWAVKDAHFNIDKGEVVGILGPNGAGKSTILKLLSRIMLPTRGSMKINGRLSALIEVTAGFHPELTGRENVYLNGTILGMKRKEIDKKFEEIVEFSGIKEFIDTPVKRYSSGMYSRLGFSVAAHMDPDILLVDEVLSVGDSAFQAKCAEKMRELMNSGATIVLVSHNLSLIQSLCKRSILITHGEVLKDGPTEQVLPYYENIILKNREEELKWKAKSTESNYQVKIKTESLLVIDNVTLHNEKGNTGENFKKDDDITVSVDYSAREKISNPVFRLDILRADGVLCCSSSTDDNGVFVDHIKGKGNVKIKLGKLNLSPDVYLLKISVWDKDLIHSYLVRYRDVLRIEAGGNKIGSTAVFMPPIQWVLTPSSKAAEKEA